MNVSSVLHIRLFAVCQAVLMLLISTAFGAAAARADEQSVPDIIEKLNEGFRSSYVGAMKEDLAQAGPIIVVGGGKVTLLRGGKRDEHDYIPDQYRILKTIDHVPLAIFVMLTNHTDKPLGDDMIDAISSYRKEIAIAESKVDGFGLSADQVQRAHSSLTASMAFLDQVIAVGRVTHSDLYGFTKQSTGALMDNAYDAVALELGGLNDRVMAWKKDMTPAEWDKLHVVVMGGHMPRQQDRQMQYFQKLLGDREEGLHIIYWECPADEAAAVDLLCKHLVDAAIGEAFFGDRMRMHRDLLSDAARRYLQNHGPEPVAPEVNQNSK